MEKYSLSFLLGNLLLHQFAYLDGMTPIWLMVCCAIVAFILFATAHLFSYHKRQLLQISLVLFFFCGGFGLAWWNANKILSISLADDLQAREMVLRGYIDSIPTINHRVTRFNLKITEIPNYAKAKILGGKVRLAWYRDFSANIPALKVGDLWQFKVKLKKPSSYLNPGGIDYEKWFFQQRIRATGYIRKGKENQLQSVSFPLIYGLDRARQNLSSRLDHQLHEHPYHGLLKALVLGIKTDISPEHWKVFIDSGTNHLIAISGLHIGLLAAIGFFLGRYLWSVFPRLLLLFPAQQVGAISAILFALIYAALAGFSIPTQRALIMIGIGLSGSILKYRFPAKQILSFALLAVLLYDPMSSLANGFWLSFAAVASILFFVEKLSSFKPQGLEKQSEWSLDYRLKNYLIQYTLLPLVIFFGLLPISLLFFERLSILSPLANLFAVPWMSFFIIPLSLIASLLSWFSPNLSALVFSGITVLMEPLWWWLSIIVSNPFNLVYLSRDWITIVLSGLFLTAIILLRKWGRKRFLCLLAIFPLLGGHAKKIPEGHFKLSVLDVGQGLAMLLRTSNHVLMYDTGNAFGKRFNMADQVIIPYLRHTGITAIDRLVLSHADSDHVGAAKYLLKTFYPKHVLTGEVKRLQQKQNIEAENCYAGQKWQWDGVTFEVISPSRKYLNSNYKISNNLSCVIFIQASNGYSVLFTGDMEKVVEQELVGMSQIENIDLLIVGHHGSKTSSSIPFLDWVNPRQAIFTFGYQNRYGFPAEQVLRNLKQQNSRLYATINGTIDISSDLSNNAAQIKEYRKEHQRYWNRAYRSY